jgi:hypothetical protein
MRPNGRYRVLIEPLALGVASLFRDNVIRTYSLPISQLIAARVTARHSYNGQRLGDDRRRQTDMNEPMQSVRVANRNLTCATAGLLNQLLDIYRPDVHRKYTLDFSVARRTHLSDAIRSPHRAIGSMTGSLRREATPMIAATGVAIWLTKRNRE